MKKETINKLETDINEIIDDISFYESTQEHLIKEDKVFLSVIQQRINLLKDIFNKEN